MARECKYCEQCGAELPAPQEQCANCSSKIMPAKRFARMWFFAGVLSAVVFLVFMVQYVDNDISTPQPELTAFTPSVTTQDERTSRQAEVKGELYDLVELPSIASANDYIALQQDATMERNDNSVIIAFMLKNISDVVCTDVGVDVEFYDAALNLIGSSSSRVHQDIQPGEQVWLVFGSSRGREAYGFCVTEIGGKPTADTVASEAEAAATASPVEEQASAPSDTDVPLSEGLTLLGKVSKNPVGGSGFYLEGRIRNDSGKKYRSVSVDFVIYDAAGDQIKTASAYTRDFNRGVTWKFSAPVVVAPQDAVAYEISSVTVY